METNDRRNEQMKAKAQAEVKARVAEKYNFNLETGKTIKPRKARLKLYKKERKEAVKQGINMINADINDLVKVEEKDYQPKKKRSLRKIIKRNFKDIVIGVALIFACGQATYYIGEGLKYIGEELKLDNITETVSDNLAAVVQECTTKTEDGTITDIDYDSLADYIQKSANPDLVLFTLYRDYDRRDGHGTKEYSDLAAKVSRNLTYVDHYGQEHKFMTFLQYASGDFEGNQEKRELLNRYYSDCKIELLHGDDLELDQLPIKVKTDEFATNERVNSSAKTLTLTNQEESH